MGCQVNRYEGRRAAPPSPAQMHRSWLELVDTDGPFLAIAPLKRVWPNGIPDFGSIHPDRYALMTDAHKVFVKAWDRLDQEPENDKLIASFRAARDAWVETVLREVIGWEESLQWTDIPGVEAHSPNHAVSISAQGSLTGTDGLGALVRVVDPIDSLRESPKDSWAANEIDRTEELLRSNEVPIGIVTDGRWWGLVSAKPGTMPASGIVDALTWIEEPRTRDAFLTILGRQYIIGGDPGERLPILFEESIAAAEEITEALGVQVRRAVELLVQSFSESSLEARRRGLPEPLPERIHDVYEAAVTIMMRTVFLLFAEERGLLPSGELFDDAYGMSGELDRLAVREAGEGEESLDSTALTWHRLLATSNALFGGATFENMRMPAYGGSLFDPARFQWLTARTDEGTLRVSVSDRVMLHVLRSVQLAILKGGEARHISFRDIDVEQIGYIYEGLLGYTAVRVDQTYVGLRGSDGSEPEIPLETLETLGKKHGEPRALAAAIRKWVEEDQPGAKAQSASAIEKGVRSEVDASVVSSLSQAVSGDGSLRRRIRPWLGVIRQDLRAHPFVVVAGGLLVEETPSRRNAGAHYTPKSLAEEVVLYALQPLCYLPGPHETSDESTWRLRSSDEILQLKIADIACGSGAFLVAAARYLAARLEEAWVLEDPDLAGRRDLPLRAVRSVVANCLYGADINDMAVEMAKLSLWLVSLDSELPFSFVDEKILLGNSLLGLTKLDQLRALHVSPSDAPKQEALELSPVDVDGIIRTAIDLRERLASEIDEEDPARSAKTKQRQYSQLREVTSQLRELADGVIAAGLRLGGKPGKALDDAYADLRHAVGEAFPANKREVGDSTKLTDIIEAGLTPTVMTDYDRWQPLHWVLEAPDVFVDRGGFDAVIGNPPFLGGKKISGALGDEFREWIVRELSRGVRGNADLVAYFVLRAGHLVHGQGGLGLIATNTIAQGDTRVVGLDLLERDGFTIVRSIRSRPWPSSSAALEFAAIWGTWSQVGPDAALFSDGARVRGISTLLEPLGKVSGLPMRLKENRGFAFLGVNVNCVDAFTMTPEEAREMLSLRPDLGSVVKPFLTGEDVNQALEGVAGRWIVDVSGIAPSKLSALGPAYDWLDKRARPARARLKTRRELADRWWEFERPAKAMQIAIGGLDRVIVLARTSRTVVPLLVPATQTFSEACVVFASSSFADLAILSSSAHVLWTFKYASAMKNDPRYMPADVFEPFPRPSATQDLEKAGRLLDRAQRRVMRLKALGLTSVYNFVNDPECSAADEPLVNEIRAAHVLVDGAMMKAYGWNDIELEHGFYEYRGMRRWTVVPEARVEILDRLLAENHRRADAEKGDTPIRKPKGKTTAMTEQEGKLFS